MEGMKNIALLSAVLAAAVPASAQMRRLPPPAFERQLVRQTPGALPTVDEMLADLRQSREISKQIAAMDQIVFSAGRLDYQDEIRVVEALQEVYDNPANDGGVRGKALDTIGKAAVWFRDVPAVREAVTVLTEAAHFDNPADARAGFKVYALFGLSRCAGHVPWTDERTEQLVVLTGLDGLRDARSAQEKLLSMMILSNYFESRGTGIVYRNTALTQRVDEQLIRWLSGGVDQLYNDQMCTSDFRYFLLRALRALAWSQSVQPDWHQRVGKIFRDMADRDPDARLRELARLYAGRISR
jgi:hypothetical protein